MFGADMERVEGWVIIGGHGSRCCVSDLGKQQVFVCATRQIIKTSPGSKTYYDNFETEHYYFFPSFEREDVMLITSTSCFIKILRNLRYSNWPPRQVLNNAFSPASTRLLLSDQWVRVRVRDRPLSDDTLRNKCRHLWLRCKGRFPEKSCCSFGFCPNYSPPHTPFWTTCTIFFNAKNVDLSDIQNDSLSKFFLNKAKQNTCFVGHVYNSLKFKLLAFWRK